MAETELTKGFVQGVSDLVLQLKMNFVVKAINDRPLTGNMFLNLAMEYVEALNQKDWTLQVLPSFEKVV